MAFADEPVRDVEYRDLYGLSAPPASRGLWQSAVDRFSPLYLNVRGYRVALTASTEDPAFVAARTAFGTAHPIAGHTMTPDEFNTHVGHVLVVTLAVTAVVGGYAYRRHRRRRLHHTARRLATTDETAWEHRRRRRRR